MFFKCLEHQSVPLLVKTCSEHSTSVKGVIHAVKMYEYQISLHSPCTHQTFVPRPLYPPDLRTQALVPTRPSYPDPRTQTLIPWPSYPECPCTITWSTAALTLATSKLLYLRHCLYTHNLKTIWHSLTGGAFTLQITSTSNKVRDGGAMDVRLSNA